MVGGVVIGGLGTVLAPGVGTVAGNTAGAFFCCCVSYCVLLLCFILRAVVALFFPLRGFCCVLLVLFFFPCLPELYSIVPAGAGAGAAGGAVVGRKIDTFFKHKTDKELFQGHLRDKWVCSWVHQTARAMRE